MARGLPPIGPDVTGFRLSRFAFFVALVALMARAMVPAGWMPAATADGRPTFALCSGSGETQGWVDADGKLHKGKPGKAMPDKPCAFAGLVTANVLSQAQPVLRPSQHNPPLLDRFRHPAPGRGLAAPPPPATGPPTLI